MSNDTESATVWVIHTGDYEQRDVFGIAVSLDAAVKHVKSRYGNPYVVDWTEPEGGDGFYILRGNFSHVQGYSTQHVGEYEIESKPVHA